MDEQSENIALVPITMKFLALLYSVASGLLILILMMTGQTVEEQFLLEPKHKKAPQTRGLFFPMQTLRWVLFYGSNSQTLKA